MISENQSFDQFISDHRWATLTTLRKSGSPVSSVVAYARDGVMVVTARDGTRREREDDDPPRRLVLAATRQSQQKRQPRRQRLLGITISLPLIIGMRGASDLSEDYVVRSQLFNDDWRKNITNFLNTRSYAFKDVRVSANTLNSWAILISS